LLNILIDKKLLLSKAKEKNYDVEQYLEVVIKEVMKQNKIPTKEDLKKALASQGIGYNQWLQFQKEELMSQTLIRSEVMPKIEVGNSELMEYYRKNSDKYTKPAEMSLNCIFLNKDNYFTKSALEQKKNEISAKLKGTKTKFEEVAKEYSELPGQDNNFFLGNYKKGELDAKIEDASFKLKKGELSNWIETGNGWYIIQLLKLTEARLTEYKTVREEIELAIKSVFRPVKKG
jgi:parvulin-like peptidyl-prolyl isomerase